MPQTTTIRTRAASQDGLLHPVRLLWQHRRRLRLVQRHSGYEAPQFRNLHLSVVKAVAEYTYLLPASRCEHHSEPGGLLHLAIETAATAAQEASSAVLTRLAGGAVRHKEHDRAWRFGIFLAGFFRTLARPSLCAQIGGAEAGQWDLFNEPLWSWVQKSNPAQLQVTWPAQDDAQRANTAALWIAGRVIAPNILEHLRASGVAAGQMIVDSTAGRGQESLIELLDCAQRTVIKRATQRVQPTAASAEVGARPLHPQLLRILQDLVKHKWTLNERSGQLWLLRNGTYVDWRAAVGDIRARMRTLAPGSIPADCDELARLLVAHGVLATRGEPPRHYFTARASVRGLPDPRAKLVLLANPALVGLDTAAVDPLDAEAELEGCGSEPCSEASDTLDNEVSSPANRRARASLQRKEHDARMLESSGTAGAVLRSIIQRVRGEPSFKVAHRLPHGVALAYPGAIEPFCDPKRFLHECEAQGWLVAKSTGKRILRASSLRANALPEQYIVLTPQIGRFLLATD